MSNVEVVLQKVRELTNQMEQKQLSNEQIATLDGLNGELDKLEEKNAVITKELAERVESDRKFSSRMDDLEKQLCFKPVNRNIDYKNSDAYKALVEGLRYGADGISEEYKKLDLLRSDDDTSGGMMTTETVSSQILAPMMETSPIRQYAAVSSISTKNVIMPTYTGAMDCEWEGEAEEGITTTTNFGTQSITPFRLSTTIPVTRDMLMNGSFDIESYVTSKAIEAFSLKENLAFVSGSGVKQPMGFLTKDEIVNNCRDAEVTLTRGPTGDLIILLLGDLKDGYNEMLTFNRRSLAILRTIKDEKGSYLWSPALNGGVANTIAGCPYFLSADMPDFPGATGDTSIPIMLADWRRGYQIVDRTGVSYVRDEITQKRKAIVEITVHKWVTGAPVIMEAFKGLKCTGK